MKQLSQSHMFRRGNRHDGHRHTMTAPPGERRTSIPAEGNWGANGVFSPERRMARFVPTRAHDFETLGGGEESGMVRSRCIQTCLVMTPMSKCSPHTVSVFLLVLNRTRRRWASGPSRPSTRPTQWIRDHAQLLSCQRMEMASGNAMLNRWLYSQDFGFG